MFLSVCEAICPKLSLVTATVVAARNLPAIRSSIIRDRAAVVLLRRLVQYLPLDRFKRHQVQLRGHLIRHQLLHQRALRAPTTLPAAPRRPRSAQSPSVRPAPHHFIGGYRRVEPAGEQASHAPAGIRRQAAHAGNLARIHQHRPRRDLDPAGQLRIVQPHPHIAPGSLQMIEQIAPHDPFDVARAHRKRLVAAFGAHQVRAKAPLPPRPRGTRPISSPIWRASAAPRSTLRPARAPAAPPLPPPERPRPAQSPTGRPAGESSPPGTAPATGAEPAGTAADEEIPILP